MRRVWAGIGQAVESAAIAAVGLVLCALVLLAVWGIDQGFGGDPLLQWRIAVDAWMLGHGVDVGISLGAEAAAALGLDSAGRAFVLTLGAWGIGVITFWLHWRSGRRLAELPLVETVIAVTTGTAATGVVGLLAGMSAQHPTAAPNLGQAFAHPAIVALAGMVAAIVAARGHDWLQSLARALTIDDLWMRPVRAALRAGLGGAVGVLGIGALLVAVGLFLRFTDGLLIMESLEVTHVGVAVLFLVQLALVPVAVVWGAAWAIGPGFMLGRGSSVSPLDTGLGPVPALPMLSAIDPDVQPWMLVVVALPVLVAVVVGALARQTLLAGSTDRPVHWWELAIAGVGGGVLAGALLGLAAMLSAGAAGPGRLSLTGPDAVLVAAWGALEVGVGLLIGLFAGGRGTGRLAGGIALPLAVEGEGTSMRDVLGFGQGRDEPVDDADTVAADVAAVATDVAADPADEGGDPAEADADPADAPDAPDAHAPDAQATDVVVPFVLRAPSAEPADAFYDSGAADPIARPDPAHDGHRPTHPANRSEGDDPER
ncbi:DUF6350 family protein [Agrococcus sp. DT81.2]|uniref:cell division protein PerM n=1 Tax=Agrococcus sp. DT81.2 TaxID=3393414 RepID=UPI003CE524E8